MPENQGQQAGQQQGIQIPMQNVLKAVEMQRNAALSDLAMAHGTIEYLQQQIQTLMVEAADKATPALPAKAAK